MSSRSDRLPRRLMVGTALLVAALAPACAREKREPPPAATVAAGGATFIDPKVAERAAMMGPTFVDAVKLPTPHSTWQTEHVLRVCADPNNLPFSNRAGEGIENRLAEMIAHDIGARVAYTWWPQRRGFVRQTLGHGECDVMLGAPSDYERLESTTPYYRSTYVFVTRRDRNLRIHSFDDPRLRTLRIGLHAIGDDYSNGPAAEALAKRGITGHLVGYSIYGDYSKADPPAELLRAVARGDVDVAIAWGPLAGYYARKVNADLVIDRVTPDSEPPGIRFAYDISAGVRRGDTATRAMLERSLARHQGDIRKLLLEFGVPLAERTVAYRTEEAAR
ncbi:MAG: substrate-binding domain-containing protein [Gemmatimonadales bacterium]